MRGVYHVSVAVDAVTTSKTLIYFTVPWNMCVEILSAGITNKNVDTNEQLEAGIYKITDLGTPTATALTPVPLDNGSGATSINIYGDVTASEPTYASMPYFHEAFSNLIGFRYDPIPESKITLSPLTSVGLKIVSPVSTFDSLAYLVYREIGG